MKTLVLVVWTCWVESTKECISWMSWVLNQSVSFFPEAALKPSVPFTLRFPYSVCMFNGLCIVGWWLSQGSTSLRLKENPLSFYYIPSLAKSDVILWKYLLTIQVLYPFRSWEHLAFLQYQYALISSLSHSFCYWSQLFPTYSAANTENYYSFSFTTASYIS